MNEYGQDAVKSLRHKINQTEGALRNYERQVQLLEAQIEATDHQGLIDTATAQIDDIQAERDRLTLALDNLRPKLQHALTVKAANAASIILPDDLPALPGAVAAAQGGQVLPLQGQQVQPALGNPPLPNNWQQMHLVPGYANPRPRLMEAVNFCKQHDSGPLDLRSMFTKLFDYAIANQLSHAQMRTVLASLLTGTHAETFRIMSGETLKTITDHFMALSPPTMTPSIAEAQLASFRRRQSESVIAAMQRWLQLNKTASILYYGDGDLQDKQKITQLKQIVGPKTRAKLCTYLMEQQALYSNCMPYDAALHHAHYTEVALGEFDPQTGYIGEIAVSAAELYLNQIDYGEVQAAGLRTLAEKAKGRTSPYQVGSTEHGRTTRAAAVAKQRSASREAEIDKRRALTPEKYDLPPDPPPPAIPQPVQYNFAPPTVVAPLPPPVVPQPTAYAQPPPPRPSSPGPYRQPSHYPASLDYNNQDRSRRDQYDRQQQQQQPRRPSNERDAIPQQHSYGPPPTSSNHNQSYGPQGQNNYRGSSGGRNGYRNDQYGQSRNPGSSAERRGDNYGPRRNQSGVRSREPSGERQWSNVKTIHGQVYPRFRIKGIHVPNMFDFDNQPDFCQKCGGPMKSGTKEVITNKTHKTFACPFYLAWSEIPCKICNELGIYAEHFPRDCMRYTGNSPKSSN